MGFNPGLLNPPTFDPDAEPPAGEPFSPAFFPKTMASTALPFPLATFEACCWAALIAGLPRGAILMLMRE